VLEQNEKVPGVFSKELENWRVTIATRKAIGNATTEMWRPLKRVGED